MPEQRAGEGATRDSHINAREGRMTTEDDRFASALRVNQAIAGVLGQGDVAACGHPNPVWFTDSRLWNEVMTGDPDESAAEVLCPSCFADRADKRFVGKGWIITGWQLVPEMRRDHGLPQPAEPTADLLVDEHRG